MNAVKEITRELVKAGVFSFDVETTSKIPREARLKGIGFAFWDSSRNVQTRWVDLQENVWEKLQALAPAFEDQDHIAVAWNAKYDWQVLKLHGLEITCPMADAMIMRWLLNENLAGTSALGLKESAKEILGVEMMRWEDTLEQDLFGVSLAEYCQDDAKYTLLLFEHMMPELQEEELDDVFWNLEMPVVPIVGQMEINGVAIDREYFKQYRRQLQEEMLRIEEQVREMTKEQVLLSSPQQLENLLFKKLKLRPVKQGKSGHASTDYETLIELKDQHPVVPLLIDYRDRSKILSTYAEPFLSYTNNGSSRMYPSYWMTGTVIGRFSSTSPNFQNLPRESNTVRKGIVSEEGNVLLDADYNQLELRIMAHQSKDPTMLKVYREGLDIHDMTRKAVGLPDSKEGRTTAKNINFGLQYGAGPKRIQHELWVKAGIRITDEQVKEYVKKFFETYPGIKKYHHRIARECEANGYVLSILKRRRRLKDSYDAAKRYRQQKNEELAKQIEGKANRQAVQFTISGSASDILMVAMRNFDRKIREVADVDKLWKNVKIIGQIHDELLYEVPESISGEVAKALKECMQGAIKKGLDVLLVADCGIGKSWEEAKSRGK